MHEEKNKRVLIIGGGFAGLSCARQLARRSNIQVTLVDRENHHLFQPLLYQVASAALAAPDIARSLRALFDYAPNVTVLLDEILEIDAPNKVARSAEFTYPFDYLVLATGVQTTYFGNDAWAAHTHRLKSLADAHKIRQHFFKALERAELTSDPEERRRLMTVAIVGGGPTGVELAGAFSDLARRALKSDFRRLDTSELRVRLIQSGDRILKPFEKSQSLYAKQRLDKLGVEVVLNNRVTGVDAHTLHFDHREPMHAEIIIWAAGVSATPISKSLAESLCIETGRGGRITPSPDLSIEGHQDFFVIGDITSHTDAKGQSVPGLAPAAAQMGKYVGKRISTLASAPGEHPCDPFNYKDKGFMAIIGKNVAVAQMNGVKLKGFLAWVVWLFVHLLFLIGFRNKVSVLWQWAWAYMKDRPGARVFSREDCANEELS